MMGKRKVRQDALFCEFLLERHMPAGHPLRAIVETATGLSVPTRAQVSEIESSSRLNTVGDALYLSTPAIARNTADVPETTPIGLVLSPRHLISIRFAGLKAFGTAGQRLPPRTGSAEAFVSLFEAIVDRLADVLEQVGSRLDDPKDVFRPEPQARTQRRAADMALRDTLRTVIIISALIPLAWFRWRRWI